MTARLNPYTAAPDAMKPWMAISDAANAGLEHSLVELVKMRASILNGCANCINMHAADARAAGESEQRLYLLAAWHEAPCYTQRERAALAWTDALTTLSHGHTHDAAWGALADHFSEEERVKLTLLVNVINGWNRIATAFGLWIETPRYEEVGGVIEGNSLDDAALAFDPLRPRLTRVAYRMLGSVADAEDAVQESFIRWLGTDRAQVREPEAFLRRTVTRLCLDQLKSARHRRETYIGPWLPDPIVEEEDEVEDVTLPLMLALERLSPLERAAFLLHDVFGLGFDEVAATIDRDPAACRQLASRARSNVQAERPRFQVEKRRGLEIAEAFFDASRSGDLTALGAMLASDVSSHSDGGGKRVAAMKLILGAKTILRLHRGLAVMYRKYPSRLLRIGMINGLPGFVTREADGELQTTALDIEDGRISAIYIMRNPDKLQHLN